jgi:hypothetical protein
MHSVKICRADGVTDFIEIRFPRILKQETPEEKSIEDVETGGITRLHKGDVAFIMNGSGATVEVVRV